MSEIKITVDGDAFPKEFMALVRRCYEEEKPEDIKELRLALKEDPSLFRGVLDISDGIQSMLADLVFDRDSQPAANLGVNAHVRSMKNDMYYDQVPVLERLLIDDIVNSWLHFIYIEMKYTRFLNEGGTFIEGNYWERKLSSSQRRYLRSIETLARVRKITGSTYQVNIATEGGQQINVAGDLVKKD